jgi:RNA polymerase sigma factor (sigma-70 family)
MAANSTCLLKQLVRVATSQGSAGLCDRDLLRRFAETGDQGAFGTLFRRHSGMVLGMCRRVLPTEQDAEDACQATFLLLSRKAKSNRWQPSVANWLYLTARRVARNARVTAARRVQRERSAAVREVTRPVDQMTGRELLDILDEEMDKLPARYREPLALCYLQGLSREEAAARLGVLPGTLKSNLERGRKRLGQALTRRGCVAGAGLLILAATTAARAISPRLYESVRSAVAGSPSAGATKLAQAVAGSVTGKTKLAGLGALVGAIALGMSLTAHTTTADSQPSQPAMPARTGASSHEPARNPDGRADQGKEETLNGTVFGVDGKPLAGAKLHLLGKSGRHTELCVTAADGRFTSQIPRDRRSLRLVATAEGFGCDFLNLERIEPGAAVELHLVKDHAVRGRVVDTQGRPVAGVSVHVREIHTYENNSLDGFLVAWKKRPFNQIPLGKSQLYEAPASVLSAKTNAVGRFTLSGAGDERFLHLRLDGAGIAAAEIWVVNRAGLDPGPYNQATNDNAPKNLQHWGNKIMVEGPEPTVVAEPEKLIRGSVIAADTGKPRAGIEVLMARHNNGSDLLPVFVRTQTDENGRFILHGARKAIGYWLEVQSDPEAGCLARQVRFDDTPGYEPMIVELRVFKGVIVTGRIRERSTGEAYTGFVETAILPDNEFASRYKEFRLGVGMLTEQTADDGAFRVVTIPGRVILIAGAYWRSQSDGRHEPHYFRRAVADPNYPQYFTTSPVFPGMTLYRVGGAGGNPINGNWCKVLDIKPGTEVVHQDVLLESAPTLQVLIRDEAGKPLTGVRVAGWFGGSDLTCKTDSCTGAYDLQPGKTQVLVFFDQTRSLAASMTLHANEKSPATVTLRPTGKLNGRLTDTDGTPLVGVAVDVKYKDRPAAQLHGQFNQYRQCITDTAGSFTMQPVFPDLEFDLSFKRRSNSMRTLNDAAPLSVASGETKDLGILVVTPRARGPAE